MLSPTPHPIARQPAINLPPATKYLILTLVLIHVARLFLSPAVDEALVVNFGFDPARYSDPDFYTGGIAWPALVAPITYMFLHNGWLHLGVNVVSLAAFGSGVERPTQGSGSARTMLIVFFVSGIAAALFQYAVTPHDDEIVIGASGGISGLFAYAFFAMMQTHELTVRRVFTLIVLMVAMLAATGIAGMPGNFMGEAGAPIAWLAHIGGFLAGAALYFLRRRKNL